MKGRSDRTRHDGRAEVNEGRESTRRSGHIGKEPLLYSNQEERRCISKYSKSYNSHMLKRNDKKNPKCRNVTNTGTLHGDGTQPNRHLTLWGSKPSYMLATSSQVPPPASTHPQKGVSKPWVIFFPVVSSSQTSTSSTKRFLPLSERAAPAPLPRIYPPPAPPRAHGLPQEPKSAAPTPDAEPLFFFPLSHSLTDPRL